MQISQHSLKPLSIALALVAALVLAACGDDSGSSTTDLGADPATLVPADAPIYLEAVVKPEGDLQENVESALSKLLSTDDPGAMITDAIDSELAGEEAGVSWDEVDGWLGSRVGGFVTDFSSEQGEGAAVIAVTDAEAAQGTLDKLESTSDSGELSDAEYEGISYKVDSAEGGAYGFVEDFLVIGTEQGFKDAVDASAGDSLADDEVATEALDSTSEGSLFSAFADAGAVIDQLVASGGLREQDLGPYKEQLDELGNEPVVFAGGAEEDAFFLESSAPATEEAVFTDIVSSLPSGAWFAFGIADLGKTLQISLDSFLSSLDSYSVQTPGLDAQGDLPDIPKEIEKQTGFDIEQDLDLGWIGDVGGFVQGTSIFGLGGGLVIETVDEAAATAAIDDLEKALSGERSVQLEETADGFSLQVQGAPVGGEVAVRDGKVVFAAAGATVDEILSPSETLDSSDRFGTASEALGEDLTPIMFVDFTTILELVESTGQATSDPEYQAAQQYLGAIDFIVAGASSDGERAISRFVLGVRESESDSGTAATLVP